MRRWVVVVAVVLGLVVWGGAVALGMGSRVLAPVRSALNYPWATLSAEAETMNDCVECHEPVDFHTCETCHDDHGSAEMAGVPFNDLILLLGDVPKPAYVPVNDILPYREQPGTHVSLLEFLAEQGVTEFESVTLASRDGGFVTFDREDLTAEALLMPHVESVRFAAENLHVSTWLKGVWRVIVVGKERPLTIDGQTTSIGRLLLEPTRSVTIEQADVMFKSESDGQVRKAKTASRVEGVPLHSLVALPDFRQLVVRDAAGVEHTIEGWETQGALLVQPMSPGIDGRPPISLVLPERGRAQWVTDLVEIRSEE
jgi:hypothetical protein